MAEHSYEIVIKLDGEGSSVKQTGKSKAKDMIAKSDDENNNGLIGTAIAYKSLKNFTEQAISYNVSTLELTTGNSESQARMQFAINTVNDSIVLGGAIASGNYLSAVLTMMNKVTSIVFNQSKIDLKQRVENESLSVSRQRAGIAFNRSRTN